MKRWSNRSNRSTVYVHHTSFIDPVQRTNQGTRRDPHDKIKLQTHVQTSFPSLLNYLSKLRQNLSLR